MSCSGTDEFTLPDGLDGDGRCSRAPLPTLSLLLLTTFFFLSTTSHLEDIYFTSVSLCTSWFAFKVHPGPPAWPTAEETCCKNTEALHTCTPSRFLQKRAFTLLLRLSLGPGADGSDRLRRRFGRTTPWSVANHPRQEFHSTSILKKKWAPNFPNIGADARVFSWTFAAKLDLERSSLIVHRRFLFVLWTPLEKPGRAGKRSVCGFGASLRFGRTCYQGADGKTKNWLGSSQGMAFLTDQHCNIKALASVHIEVPFTGWNLELMPPWLCIAEMTQQIAAAWDWHLCEKKKYITENQQIILKLKKQKTNKNQILSLMMNWPTFVFPTYLLNLCFLRQ